MRLSVFVVKTIAAARMILVCCFISLYLIVVGIPVLTFCRLIGNPKPGLYLTRLLDRMVHFLARVPIRVRGLEKIKPGQGYVYIGNHRSFIDVTAAFLALPGDLRFLAKKELFKIPLLSFALRTLETIAVDRSNPEAGAQSIERAVEAIRSGKSVILFPEGTRSRKPGLLPFKKGAFVLAIKAQVPIVPVTFIGTDDRLKPDTLFLFSGPVDVIINDPIPTERYSYENRNELLQKARTVIEKQFEAPDSAS